MKDSWRQIQKDVEAMYRGYGDPNGARQNGAMKRYCEARGVDCPGGYLVNGVMKDLVARCRALAEEYKGEEANQSDRA